MGSQNIVLKKFAFMTFNLLQTHTTKVINNEAHYLGDMFHFLGTLESRPKKNIPIMNKAIFFTANKYDIDLVHEFQLIEKSADLKNQPRFLIVPISPNEKNIKKLISSVYSDYLVGCGIDIEKIDFILGGFITDMQAYEKEEEEYDGHIMIYEDIVYRGFGYIYKLETIF